MTFNGHKKLFISIYIWMLKFDWIYNYVNVIRKILKILN